MRAEMLHRPCDVDNLRFVTTAELDESTELLGQERALTALRFGTDIEDPGFNVFGLGPNGIGKHTSVSRIVEQAARTNAVPSDWCYVHNFTEPHRPNALRLPAGMGRRLRNDMAELVADLKASVPSAFESEQYHARIAQLGQELNEKQESAIAHVRAEAEKKGIVLIPTPAGFAFAPMGEDGNAITPADFEKLDQELRGTIEANVRGLQEALQTAMAQVPVWQQTMHQGIRALNREVAEFAVRHLIRDARTTYAKFEEVGHYLDEVEKDIISNVGLFRASEENAPLVSVDAHAADGLRRYEVNLLVDNAELSAAPVVYEDFPSYLNLLGRTEQQAQMGALVTDFTLIKSGALHRANGGFLVLDARRLLSQPYAWESLKRALQAKELKIVPLERTLSLISTTILEPEPIPLTVKVILVGDRELYYLLVEYDPDFARLFKVVADFEDEVDRDVDSEREFAKVIGTLARNKGLRPLEREGVGRVIEHASRRVEDARKLSLRLEEIEDLLREANHIAEADAPSISRANIESAIAAKRARVDRLRERTLESFGRGTHLCSVSGQEIGQINGLAVLSAGGVPFGRPSRITATTRLGAGTVLDIERETELGGPLHSKGVLILAGFLTSHFATEIPLSMSATLVFEQSYGQIDGDSASLAELCALMSSLAEVPIKQCYGVTGSVNQRGIVQPIGGVNEKVEGFFDVCELLGRDDRQGVVIPASNTENLMLRSDIVEAVQAEHFAVNAVKSIDEALFVLTGIPAGRRDWRGEFPPDSINGRVEARLTRLSDGRRDANRRGGRNAIA
ncbi:MAG: AAA family ATPase [Gammaproteobacteria bacterium]|nr:AAA family ATPase [Gammaproteobacteria bacterium]